MKNYLVPFVLCGLSTTAFAVEKVGHLKIKQYTEAAEIINVLTTEEDSLEEPACINEILDSPEHKAQVALGRSIKVLTLDLVKIDGDKYVVPKVQYGPRGKGPVVANLNFPSCVIVADDVDSDQTSEE